MLQERNTQAEIKSRPHVVSKLIQQYHAYGQGAYYAGLRDRIALTEDPEQYLYFAAEAQTQERQEVVGTVFEGLCALYIENEGIEPVPLTNENPNLRRVITGDALLELYTQYHDMDPSINPMSITSGIQGRSVADIAYISDDPYGSILLALVECKASLYPPPNLAHQVESMAEFIRRLARRKDIHIDDRILRCGWYTPATSHLMILANAKINRYRKIFQKAGYEVNIHIMPFTSFDLHQAVSEMLPHIEEDLRM